MSNTAFLKQPLSGFAGRISRQAPGTTVEPHIVSGTNTPTFYGQGVVVGADNSVALPVGADKIDGILVQSFPMQQRTGGDSAAFGPGTPIAATADNLLRRGYVSVKIPTTQADPAAYGTVYVRVANGSTATPVGGFETETSADVIEVAGAYWASTGTSGSGIAEVAFNI